jgi:hypothetical protein
VKLEHEGHTWWKGRITGSCVSNDPPSYLVTFDDARFTGVYCTRSIRKSVELHPIVLKKITLPIPRKVVLHAGECLVRLDHRRSFFCLRLFKDSAGVDFILIIGRPDDVDELCQTFKFHISMLERLADLVSTHAGI